MLLTLKAPFSNHQWPSLVAQEPGTRGLAHKNLPGRALPPACEPAAPARPCPPVSARSVRPCAPVPPAPALAVTGGDSDAHPPRSSSARTLRLLTSAPASVRMACLPSRLSCFWCSGRPRSPHPHHAQQGATHANLGLLVEFKSGDLRPSPTRSLFFAVCLQ